MRCLGLIAADFLTLGIVLGSRNWKVKVDYLIEKRRCFDDFAIFIINNDENKEIFIKCYKILENNECKQ